MNRVRYAWENSHKYIWHTLLGIISIFVIGSYWYTAFTGSKFSVLESFLWQLFGIVCGVVSSALFSREISRGVDKKHARSAFRRLLSLAKQIRLAEHFIEFSQSVKSIDDYKLILARLEGTVSGQISMVDDALEDWKDIVPEEIEKIEAEARDRRARESRQWQS